MADDKKQGFDIESILTPVAEDSGPKHPLDADERIDLAEHMRILDLDMKDEEQLRYNGMMQKPDDDHVPVAHYRSVDGTIDIWLTAQQISKSELRRRDYGLVDFGNGSPEIGPIEFFQIYVLSLDHPGSRLVRDRSYSWSENGRRVHDILAEKRRLLHRGT